MYFRTAIDVDCSQLVPDCGFDCSACFAEVRRTLNATNGVNRLHIEQRGEDRRLSVEHDPSIVPVAKLVNLVEQLPTRHAAHFQAKLITM
jgi:hypothetical protein